MNIFEDIKHNFRQKDNGLIKIILINIIVFVALAILRLILKISSAEGLFYEIYSMLSLPAEFSRFIFRPWTLLTYFFTHSMEGLFHIIGNMLFLYWFGKIISEYIGNRRLVNLYLLGGLFGGIIFLFLFNLVPFYINRSLGVSLVGASGSVCAIVIAAATLVPHYRFNLLLLGPVKITYIAAFFVIMSLLGSTESNAGGNVCHLGGALFGYLYISQLRKGRDLGRPINFIANVLKNIGKPKMKVTYRSNTKSTKSNIVSQEEIDLILDKINQSGYESLSKEEKEKLFKASEK
jgi:membrane associated rhomboid family serine protease